MLVNIDLEEEIPFDTDCNELFNNITESTLENLNLSLSDDWEVNVLICGNESIRDLNREYRNIDRETDVLSFPMFDFSEPGVIPESIDTENVLGDIVISVDKVLTQAEEYGHSPYRELAFLFTHGLLHILGYDHIDDSDRVVMEKLQEEILLALNINR